MEFLGVILDSLLIVLVIILIVLALKTFDTLNKVDAILDDTKKKLDSLDGVFNLVDNVSNKLTLVTDTVVGSIVNFITSIFNKKGKGDIDE
ncbi:MAG TPA: hypothetical protein IAB59_00780 [Candidatus Onthousia faecipullorum]|uniref:Uncharacterized protein n=1 Tax=Candidatus Onthousia faecipullorum TaxID=2840887 RepID=A0A9D1GA02_9FIRM|nr:hypothetical protein [Candidatus Onthousia faecipullorum]